MIKLTKLDEDNAWYSGDFYWVGNPRCEDPGSDEKLFIERRDEVEVFGGIEDKDADYSYDDWALCRLDGAFYLLSTSGCSCPSPSETWHVQMGPATLAEIKARLLAGEYDGYTVPRKQMADFINLIEQTEKETA